MRTLALVVPGLELGGGVPSVARFVAATAIRSGCWTVRLVSLSMNARDPESVCILRPATWPNGVRTRRLQWQAMEGLHVGALLGEFEFQRYRKRHQLSAVLRDCDLIQLVAGTPAWANAVVGLGPPVSLQVATRAAVERRRRDANVRTLSGAWRRLMTTVTDGLDDMALKRVDAIQVENPWMLGYAAGLNPGRKVDIRYAPPGVDSSRFTPTATRTLDRAPYLLIVGRLDDPRKNVEMVLDACSNLAPRVRGSLRIVLAGAARPPAHFWHCARSMGIGDRVTFTSNPGTEELAELYRNAAMFALTSDEEGLGVVVLEAMSSGVPVIATRCGGPEGIITDGEDGFLIERDDAGGMADRIQLLLADHALNRRMGEAARRTIERRFDDRVAGQPFLDVWDRLSTEARTV